MTMPRFVTKQFSQWRWARSVSLKFLVLLTAAAGQAQTISNGLLQATFSDGRLQVLRTEPGAGWAQEAHFTRDGWSLLLNGTPVQGHGDLRLLHVSGNAVDIAAPVEKGFEICLHYELKPGALFLSKTLVVTSAPGSSFTIGAVQPLDLSLAGPAPEMVTSTGYAAQSREDPDNKYRNLATKQFGAFLRSPDKTGVMLLVMNPFLDIERADESTVRLSYTPNMRWQTSWGAFATDAGLIGLYRQTGNRLPTHMVPEWKADARPPAADGLDSGEIDSFRRAVRSAMIAPPAQPLTLDVGWTLNDYQMDVGTPAGVAAYQHVIDAAASMGVHNVLYAPSNSHLSNRALDEDSWSWEHTLWLNLGQKIAHGEWNPKTDPVPNDIQTMVSYARQHGVRLLAYVYPSVPVHADPAWILHSDPKYPKGYSYSNLASRGYQDWLITNLEVFKERTGIAGYSFDYAFLDFDAASTYAQWYGWRRVLQAIKQQSPDIVIDGRQSYQLYGPWSWLAGSYPHPTGGDEQPESFKPFPDLHFDRVSADRARFVNYWYRNYQYAPSELIPGYAGHQTERLKNETVRDPQGHEMVEPVLMETDYRLRDWDYTGFPYSLLSSIATGGWNNLLSMIPARDQAERESFTPADRQWVRDWLKWAADHKEYLRNTRTILSQPQLGHADGTAACLQDHCFVFLFNPNYRHITDSLTLDRSLGFTGKVELTIRELYPDKGRLWGKLGKGTWSLNDTVPLDLDGTSATVLEIGPATAGSQAVYNVSVSGAQAVLVERKKNTLYLSGVAGEPGTTRMVGVPLNDAASVRRVIMNRQTVTFHCKNNFLSAEVHFAGRPFQSAQEVTLAPALDGGLEGTFTVPQRIFAQLRERQKAWPILWTLEDLQTTWLAPERLLLFIQTVDPAAGLHATVELDGRPLPILPAFSSVRTHLPSATGFYADLSRITPDVAHHLRIRPAGLPSETITGVFFDNVQSDFTTRIEGGKAD